MRNYWYIGCASRQLLDGPLAVEILDERLVLFRNAAGKASALKDRCCHRGMPLSKGKVTGDTLQCGYHGWEFDGGGRCVKVPSQVEDQPLPKTFCVPSFPCIEQDGYVWVWPDASAPTRAVPSIPEFAGQSWKQGSAVVACHYLRALEVTYDGSHLYFVHATHPATIAAKKHGFAEAKGETRLTDDGCIAFMPVTGDAGEAVPPHAMSMEFSLPGRIRFRTPAGPQLFYMYFHVTPIGERRCRIDWLISDSTPGGHGVTFVPHSSFLQEDVDVLEAVQRSYDAEGDAFERSCAADGPTLLLRRIVRMAEAGTWRGRASDLPTRKITSQLGPAAYG